jgi:putative ABC transport system substrate-binding protein
MKRLLLICLFTALLPIPYFAEAQQAATGYRVIGLLSPSSSAVYSSRVEAFRQRLNSLGYIEDKNIKIEYRYANGNLKQLSGLANELNDRKVELILASSSRAIEAVIKINPKLPVVFAAIGSDPVQSGFVTSLARPGGNITGITIFAPEWDRKRVELLIEALPKIKRIAFLQCGGKTCDDAFNDLLPTAKALGLQLTPLKVRNAEELDSVIERAKSTGISALVVMPLPLFTTQQNRVVDLTVKHSLPAIFSNSDFVENGGLISYGPRLIENYRRAADYVDKILKGAKPADLPVEQPTKFELVINLKAARQIGLTIPPNVLARADKVIR